MASELRHHVTTPRSGPEQTDNKVSSGVGMVMSEYCGHGAGRRTAIWLHKGPSTGSASGTNVELKMVRYVCWHSDSYNAALRIVDRVANEHLTGAMVQPILWMLWNSAAMLVALFLGMLRFAVKLGGKVV